MTTPPIASVTVGPADPTRAPTNPYHVQAIALADARDRDGLIALEAYLAEAGYAADGQVRTFIAGALGALEG